MALIHWWPLNGDVKDQGLDPVQMTALGSSTLTSAGKIGKCYKNTSYSDGGYVSTTKINYTKTHSMFAWINFTQLTSDSSLGGCVLGCHRYPSNTGMGITIRYLSSTTGRLSINTGTGSGRTYNTYYGNTTLNANTWYHVGYTYDGTTVRFYVNGVADGTASVSGQSLPEDFVMIGCWSLGSSTTSSNSVYGGYKLYGYINDCRIYNHTCSPKEVKEISKGLFLHYNFELDDECEPTTNLASQNTSISGWNNSGTASYNSNDTNIPPPPVASKVLSITQTTAGQSAACFAYTSGVASKTVIASMWFYMSGEHTSGSSISPYIRGSKQDSGYGSFSYNGSSNYKNWPNETWIRVTTAPFTVRSDETSIYFCSYSATLNEKFCFAGWQIEEKDHITPWVNGSRTTGIGFDSSGFNYHGNSVNNCVLRDNSEIGKYSLRTQSTTMNNSSYAAYLKTDLGISLTPNRFTIAFWACVNTFGVQESGLFSLSNSSSNPADYSTNGVNQYDSITRFNMSGTSPTMSCSSSSLITTGSWHHYAFVYNGSTVVSYKDGTQYESKSASGNINAFRYIYIGLSTAGGVWRTGDVSWGDFKLYATNLSANDIKKEYQSMASIDKKYNLETTRFIENDSRTAYALLNKASVFDNKNIICPELKTLSDGSRWMCILNHDIRKDKTMFASANEAKLCLNKTNRFSLLIDLEKFKSTDNYFEFLYALPETGTIEAGFYNRWKQTSNPNTAAVGTSTGYTAVGTLKWTAQFSGGIARSSDTSGTYLDTTVATSTSNWWGAVGAYTTHNNGIPCADQVVHNWYQLWVRIDNTNFKGYFKTFDNGILLASNFYEF